jgi:DNA mismatch repair protein MutS
MPQDLSNHNHPDFATPMMQQYLHVKAEYPECLLWFRLGDFYEMFLEDAKVGSQVLGIVLTSRTRGKDGRIPMAGIPYHAADSYLHKLLAAGYKVAICEQMTAPNGRGLVEREVIRVVTPGTVLNEHNLIQKEHNYVFALEPSKKALGLAIADLSTGQFLAGQFPVSVTQSAEQWLNQLIQQYHPRECVLNNPEISSNFMSLLIGEHPEVSVSKGERWPTSDQVALNTLQRHFAPAQLASAQLHHAPLAQIAAAGLYHYLEYTQKSELPHLTQLQALAFANYLQLDHSTIANLELVRNLQTGHLRGTLLHTLDQTVTAMGGRLLRDWILRPLIDQAAIEQRLDNVQFLTQHKSLRVTLHTLLSQIIDLERLLSRLGTKQGNPKDLRALVSSGQVITEIQQALKVRRKVLPSLRVEIPVSLQKLFTQLDAQIVDEPPFDPRQGGLLKTGPQPKIDQLRQKIAASQEWIAEFEQTERARTTINSLKIKFNQVFGYYIEVSHAHQAKVPPEYQRKQTLVNAERSTTPELKHHERLILSAQEQANKLEYEVFLELVATVLKQVREIQTLAHQVATLDCCTSLSAVAELKKYVRPKITVDDTLRLVAGRHPVIEDVLGSSKFIPNDVELSSTAPQLLLITGPNMAGKSVLMRQVALITIMAHLGSFVPADLAVIPLTDQIFVRSGAADMISSGLSTFMVEMVETAYILQHATERSLIIMDEIGRGTSTYDGISIAWAVAEELVGAKSEERRVKGSGVKLNCDQRGPKTLFATHYHELQALEQACPGKIQNYHMELAEHEGKPVFLYQLKPGGASHSFGVAVAELAGVKAQVVQRASEILQELESGKGVNSNGQLTSFTSQTQSNLPTSRPSHSKHLQAELAKLNLDELTPLAALQLLHDWKNTH